MERVGSLCKLCGDMVEDELFIIMVSLAWPDSTLTERKRILRSGIDLVE